MEQLTRVNPDPIKITIELEVYATLDDAQLFVEDLAANHKISSAVYTFNMADVGSIWAEVER